MTVFGRYLLRLTLVPLLVTTGIALAALLLERMLRIMNLAVGTDASLFRVFEMMMSLVPHYLGIALPAAFFIGVLLAFNRLSGDSELVAFAAAGVALPRLLVPVMGLAVVLTLITAVIFAYVQPYSRYGYRALVHAIGHASLASALADGAFVEADGMVFMAEDVSAGGRRLTRVFVYQETAAGDSVTTTARGGALKPSTEHMRSVLYLADGVTVHRDGDGEHVSSLAFDQLSRPIGETGAVSYRARGRDERELTSAELWSARDRPPAGVSTDTMDAELHGRLVRTVTMLFLPLLAIPLGLGGGRARRSYGIIVGLVVLVFYQKLLQLGGSMAALGHVSPWLGLWLPLVLFAILSAALFVKASNRGLTNPVDGVVERLAAVISRPG
ncbi:MAG: LPS export ABC transporter permease LptF [Pseudomonadota bacterium]|nr:LPS export ABC transporter permease LptF [Pseudomonadota bacterium]